MPADNNINIDDNFLEESWSVMQDLLDKEMPVSPKPKPSGKKWFTAILLMLFAWTTYLYWPEPVVNEQDENLLEENTKKDNTQPTALLQTPQLDELQLNAPKASSNYVAALMAAKTNDVSTEHSSLVNGKSLITNSNLNQTNNQQVLQETEGLMVFYSNEIAPNFGNSWIVNTGSKNIQQNQPSTVPLLEQEVKALRAKHTEMDHLESHKLLALNEKEKSSTFPILALLKEKPPMSLALRFETVFDRRLQSGSYYGLEFEKGLSSQFSITAGIGISKYKKLNTDENSFNALKSFFDVEATSFEEELELNQDLPIIYDSDDDRLSYIRINQLNYITVPVELVFAVNAKAKVIAGVGFSYLMNAGTRKASDISWVSHEDGTVVNNEQELIGTAIQRIDISPSIGISFQPMKRLSLDLKFRNGLLDISKDKFLGYNQFHSNKYLHLGASFDIFNF